MILISACGMAGSSQSQDSLPLRINPQPFADRTSTPLPTIAIPATHTLEPTITPTFVVPSLTPYPDDQRFSLGKSVQGRDLWAWQFGDGPSTIVLVGGMHGGFEGNTVVLAEELVNYFRSNPEDILPGIRLVIIPAANPDGLALGSGIEGRFNGRGVDLNRNWGCEWSPTAVLQDRDVDPGPRPFSEPEAVALRAYFVAQPPDAVVFYHSAAGGIFLGQCGDDPPASWLGDILSEASGYPRQQFTYYEVSGDASNWLAERGIAAAVIETYSKDDTEFDRNLPAVMALQCHYVMENAGDDAFDQPSPQTLATCGDLTAGSAP
jgi:hypothetical protein